MQRAEAERLPRLAAFAAPLILYGMTAHRFVGFWDTGEMDTVPYILGIAHPPGLPLYTLAGWLFSHALPFGSVAARMSIFSAIAMSLASYFIYRIVREFHDAPMAALAAALVFAAGDVAWTVATRADVHSLEAALFLCTLFLALRWFAMPSPRAAYFTAAAFGLAVAAHPVGLFLLFPIIALVIGRLHALDAAPLRATIVIALVSVCVWFVYLPLRSAYVTAMHLDPAAALGISGGAFWDYGHPVVLGNLMHLVFAGDVDLGTALHGYGNDRFVDGVAAFVTLGVRELTPIGVVAAAYGMWLAWRRGSFQTIALLLAAIVPLVFACSFRDESDVSRYFLPAFAVGSVFAGVAAGAHRIAAIALLAVSAFLVVVQAQHFRDAADRSALDQTSFIIKHTPDSAIIVAGWTLAPPLAFRAYVDGAAGHRTIVALWYGEIADVIGTWDPRRPIYVAGTPEGSVPGFRLERLSAYPELYRVERTTAKL